MRKLIDTANALAKADRFWIGQTGARRRGQRKDLIRGLTAGEKAD